VVFQSFASNLVAGDTNGATDVFVRDRERGVTRRVSVSSRGQQAESASLDPVVSADGRFVVFQSFASNLVAGDTRSADVFVRDRVAHVTRRVSVGRGGVQTNGKSRFPAISANGRYVAFSSFATNLVAGDTNGLQDVFVWDRVVQVTRRVSVGRDGAQANGYSYWPAISANGRYVAFNSDADNLVADPNRKDNVFVRDRVVKVTRRVSVGRDGAQGNGHSYSYGQAISANGRYVAFDSYATNLVTGDTNSSVDVFLRGPLR
jgi:Tol biopolymer transport system component